MTTSIEDPLKPLTDIFRPDDRQEYFSESLEALHTRLSGLVLHDDVPIDLRQMLETAKNARLYTFFVYRFHQVTEMLAYQALDRALRVRWNDEVAKLASIDDEGYKWPGMAHLIKHAGSNGWIHNEGFSSRERRAFHALTHERAVTAIGAMAASGATACVLQEPSLEEIEERAKKIDVVKILSDNFPALRNSLAHGSPRLSPDSDYVLQDVCDAISMVFTNGDRNTMILLD